MRGSVDCSAPVYSHWNCERPSLRHKQSRAQTEGARAIRNLALLEAGGRESTNFHVTGSCSEMDLKRMRGVGHIAVRQ